MRIAVVSNIIYALLVLLGGFVGFVKAGSPASLKMGLFFAVLLFTASLLIHKKMQIGLYFAMLLTLILAIFFGYRFSGSYKFMPAGLMCLISLANLVILLCKPRI